MSASDYPAELLAGSSGQSLHIWRVRDAGSSATLPSSHPGARALPVVAWNRNNKVVAGAWDDASISLSYSNGDAMTRIQSPRDSSGGPTALAWASGSKRLALGTATGSLHLHDMTTKTCCSLQLPEGIAALCYHPADRFLVVCSGQAATLLDRSQRTLGTLPAALEAGAVVHGILDAASSGLVLGHAQGTVRLWDLPSRTVVASWEGHAGGRGLAGLACPVTDAALIYAAAQDGSIWRMDRRAPSASPSSIVRLGTTITAFSLKEDHTCFAAGTADGSVYVYDPRAPSAPLVALSSGSRARIESLSWQHSFAGPSRGVGASSIRTGVPTTAGSISESSYTADRGGTHRTEGSGTGVGTHSSLPRIPGTAGLAGGTSDRTSPLGATSIVSSTLPGLAGAALTRPERLQVTPLTSRGTVVGAGEAAGEPLAAGRQATATWQSTGAEPMSGGGGATAPAATAAEASRRSALATLEEIRRRLPLAGTSAAGTGRQDDATSLQPPVTAERPRLVTLDIPSTHPHSAAVVAAAASILSPSKTAQPPIGITSGKTSAEKTLRKSITTETLSPTRQAHEDSWRIRSGAAATVGRAMHDARMSGDYAVVSPVRSGPRAGPDSPLISNDSVGPCGGVDMDDGVQGPPPSSAEERAVHPKINSPAAAVAKFGGISRDDLLALHLDMLDHFQAAQERHDRAMQELLQRQDSLASELAAVRQHLGTLLSQRNDLRWL